MQKIRTRILWQASSGGGLNVPSQLKLALLLLFVAALYFPSLENGYVGWDDALIYSNREIRSLSPGNLARMFLPSAGGTASYQPLRTLSYAVVYAANGARPFGYLLFNILLYLANIFLFYIVVEYLLAQHGGHRLRRSSANLAFVAAAAFALYEVYGYDHVQGFLTASALENPNGFRGWYEPYMYLATRMECISENALFLSFGFLAILFHPDKLGTSYCDWKKTDIGLMFSGLITLLAVFASGAYRTGETARAALFIYPYVLFALRNADSIMLKDILIIAGLQTAAMQLFGSYFW